MHEAAAAVGREGRCISEKLPKEVYRWERSEILIKGVKSKNGWDNNPDKGGPKDHQRACAQWKVFKSGSFSRELTHGE